jgi:hypothetical protein
VKPNLPLTLPAPVSAAPTVPTGYRHTFPAGAVGAIAVPLQVASSSPPTSPGAKFTAVGSEGAGTGKVTAPKANAEPSVLFATSLIAKAPCTVVPEGIVDANTDVPGSPFEPCGPCGPWGP